MGEFLLDSRVRRSVLLRGVLVFLFALTAACSSSTAPAPGLLAFVVQPTSTLIGVTIAPPVQVEIQDSRGVRQSAAQGPVTITIGTNPSGAALVGTATVNAVNGIATYLGLEIDKAGRGYTLVATSPGLSGATSAAFSEVLGFTTLAAGGGNSCGPTTGGALYCWGLNNAGRLGNGTNLDSNVPVPVSGGLSFAAVAAGGGHVCGLTAGGAAYCWGYNAFGQLGDGTTTGRSIPVAVAGGLTFALITTGGGVGDHTCALTTGGVAYCWGHNNIGQLGDGTMTDDSVPTLVSGGLTFATLSAGGAHTCGVTGSGVAHCWGSNVERQLGNGTTTSSSVPVPVSGGFTFSTIAAGGAHVCGVTTGGAAYCWGNNSAGQIGNGTTQNDSFPVPVSGGLTFTGLSAGLFHTCGRIGGGAVYCWGDNGAGQLGSGTNSSTTPVPVAGGLAFISVTAGQFHTCGLATSGGGYCWGNNGPGQLGDGTNTSRNVPVLVLLVP